MKTRLMLGLCALFLLSFGSSVNLLGQSEYCLDGTVWDNDLGGCVVALPNDANFDGCVQLSDLLSLLGTYANCNVVEGCINSMACNFDLDANTDDGSCILPGAICDDGDDYTVSDVIQPDCSCQGESIYQIGQPFEGGIIAYVLQPGDSWYTEDMPRGIIVSKHELGPGIGACHFTELLSTSIGQAQNNTEFLLSQSSCGLTAAERCASYTNEGYDDWYLPTLNDLQKIALYQFPINDAIDTSLGEDLISGWGYYWTSSLAPYLFGGCLYALGLNYSVSGGGIECWDSGNYKVRAIRYFNFPN